MQRLLNQALKLKLNFIKKPNNNLFRNPKKNFSNFNNNFNNNPFSRIAPITRNILIGNCIIYGIGMFMTNQQYIMEFFYHKYALKHNKWHVLITAHFAKANFFDFFLEGLITGLVGTQLEQMFGSALVKKLVLSSIGIGSLMLITMHKDDYFFKTEAILRGMIMYFVLVNPNASFYLFPLPIQIQAKWLGIFVVGMDMLTAKYANFGGTFAALMITRGLL